MIEFVDQTVNVEVRLRKDGTAVPLAFAWNRRRYEVVSWGRVNTKSKGEGEGTHRCHLVQTAGPETWELCQDTETAQWTLTRHWARDPRIV
jgi:hypothetical protein